MAARIIYFTFMSEFKVLGMWDNRSTGEMTSNDFIAPEMG